MRSKRGRNEVRWGQIGAKRKRVGGKLEQNGSKSDLFSRQNLELCPQRQLQNALFQRSQHPQRFWKHEQKVRPQNLKTRRAQPPTRFARGERDRISIER